MTRTDVHRPAAIVTADYRFVAFEAIKIEGLADCYIAMANRERIRADMARTGGTYSRHAHGGNCMVCGNANAIYTALFHHTPTNSYVRMGSDCAEKVDMQLDRAAFTRFRDGVYQWREAQAGKRKAEAALTERGLVEAWTLYTATDVVDKYEENTIRDIVSKLVRYGSISDRQFAFVERLLGKIKDRTAIENGRAAEYAAAESIPDAIVGTRAIISGTVLSTKTVESAYGPQRKMLVKTAAGWKLWVSVPRVIDDVERGASVEFEALVERSNTDPKFGFGSRPTKARIIEAAAIAAA